MIKIETRTNPHREPDIVTRPTAPIRIDDFGPTIRAALVEGGEVPLFDLMCAVQDDNAHVTAVPHAQDEVSETAKALLAYLQEVGEAATRGLRHGSAASKIGLTRAHTGETVLFTVAVTGTADEAGTVHTQATMTRSKTFEGIPRVRTKAVNVAKACSDTLQALGGRP